MPLKPQSIKGAIDRTIAQEQARQKALAEQRSHSSSSDRRSASISRTARTDSPARRRQKKPSQDVVNGETGPNPDPSVFEAAFVIDDDDGDTSTRSSTPKPAVPEKDAKIVKEGASSNEGDRRGGMDEQNGENSAQETRNPGEKARDDANTNTTPELPHQIKAKLRKLEKLESTYPGTEQPTHIKTPPSKVILT